MKIIKCSCICYFKNEMWNICYCKCNCKRHRTTTLDKAFFEKERMRQIFIKRAIEKKQRKELEKTIDDIVFGRK